MSKELLIEKFENELKANISKMKLIKYTPKTLIKMCGTHGYYKASQILISKPIDTAGYLKLKEKDSLGLSIESLVIKDEFKPLFSEGEIKICKGRLGH